MNDFYGSLSSDHDAKGPSSEYYARNYAQHPNDYQQQPQQPKYQQSNYPYSSSHSQQQQPQQYNRNVSNGHQRSGPAMGYGNDYRSNNVPEVQQTQPVRQQSRSSGVSNQH